MMNTHRLFSSYASWLLWIFVFTAVGCTAQSDPAGTASSTVMNQDYLTSSVWDDGQAEITFYTVKRPDKKEGQTETFTLGSYLVKHNFNPETMTKATNQSTEGVPAFKFAQFYEFSDGSYQYKYNYVTNARQRDLRPFKQAFSSFDWCSTEYREMAFRPGGSVRWLKRSDDYGNGRNEFSYQANAYPAAEIPLLVRGLDFSGQDSRQFSVVTPEGNYVTTTARLAGTEQLTTPAGTHQAERITVQYDEPVPSTINRGQADTQETYWRGTGEDRRLLKVAAQDTSYQMELVEHVRAPYWEENIFKQLKRIEERP